MNADTNRRQSYVEAYQRWQGDLLRLHRVLLDGEALDPMHRIALLRSESHTHDRYEEARRHFLGLEPDAATQSPAAEEGASNA